jgi:DNA-binding LacI/PurR family transcriptional regulator
VNWRLPSVAHAPKLQISYISRHEFTGFYMAGIEDVAKLAGVSTATVSRALSGKDHVSDKARLKVEKAAAELGYVASSSAYTLATGRNRNIGVVIPRLDSWFFGTFLESAESALVESGYDLTLYNLSGGAEQREKIFSEILLRQRVDAVLAVAVAPSASELENLNRMKKPILAIGGHIEGARSLVMDDRAAGRLGSETQLDNSSRLHTAECLRSCEANAGRSAQRTDCDFL